MIKQYNKIVFILSAIVVLVMLGAMMWLQIGNTPDVDILVLNDISKVLEENWDDSQAIAGRIPEKIIVYDYYGNIVYKSEGVAKIDYNQALRSNYRQVPVLKETTYLGTAFLLNDGESILKKKTNRVIGIMMGISFLLIGIMIVFGIYIKRRIVVPFRKMENFAQAVAEGNLDMPLTMDQGNLFGVFTESFDIMREEIAAAKKREIDLKIKEKEMVASLSHDLKTPVTSIKLTCELLMVKEQDTYLQGKISGINEKASTIDALVNDLLVSSLEDLGEMKVQCEDHEARILNYILKKVDDRELVYTQKTPECLINVDARRLEQIISNIISNSYKYAGTKIEVGYSLVEGYVRMTIRDYGPGVDGDKVHLVTNKFFRGEAKEQKKSDGSGLGLYISKTLIEKMNGEILCGNAEPGFVVNLMIPLS